ncbi:hypothetical protein F1880_008459 [Penicillium rolfsii]|nr:hypothetical protein F1880_008459 [Penicillium rolfsii]
MGEDGPYFAEAGPTAARSSEDPGHRRLDYQEPFVRQWEAGARGQSFQFKVRPEATSTRCSRQFSRLDQALPTAAAQREQKDKIMYETALINLSVYADLASKNERRRCQPTQRLEKTVVGLDVGLCTSSLRYWEARSLWRAAQIDCEKLHESSSSILFE